MTEPEKDIMGVPTDVPNPLRLGRIEHPGRIEFYPGRDDMTVASFDVRTGWVYVKKWDGNSIHMNATEVRSVEPIPITQREDSPEHNRVANLDDVRQDLPDVTRDALDDREILTDGGQPEDAPGYDPDPDVRTDGGRGTCSECGATLPREIDEGAGVYCPECGTGQHVTDGGQPEPYRIECEDCPFDVRQPTAKLAAVIRDLHHLYNNHDVDWHRESARVKKGEVA